MSGQATNFNSRAYIDRERPRKVRDGGRLSAMSSSVVIYDPSYSLTDIMGNSTINI